MFQQAKKRPRHTSFLYRGGQHENEIDRIPIGSLIVRLLAFPNGKRRVEQLHFGEWQKVTPEIAKGICFLNFRAESWFRENTDLLK